MAQDGRPAETQSTDDPVVLYRLREAQRLKSETFTAQALVKLANEQGYTFLSDGLFRIWVHRGLFPEARTRQLQARGKPGIWYRADATRLLDLCALHEANNDKQAMQLGTWLLDYAIYPPHASAETPETQAAEIDTRALLAEQLGRIERALYGQTLESGTAPCAEEEQNRAADSIERAAQNARHLDDLCHGLNPALLTDNYYEDAQESHPQMCNGAATEELRRFIWLHRAGDRRLPPVVATPDAALLFHLEGRAQRLKRAVDRNIPADQALRAIMDATPQGDLADSTMTDGQFADLARDLIAVCLWHYAGNGPWPGSSADTSYSFQALRAALAQATYDELRLARIMAEPMLFRVLDEQRVFPSPALAGLARLGDNYRWHLRRLYASPAFFPLTAYLIVALVYSQRHPRRIQMRTDLLPLALDRLARLTRESVSRADAFLAVVLTVVPVEALATGL